MRLETTFDDFMERLHRQRETGYRFFKSGIVYVEILEFSNRVDQQFSIHLALASAFPIGMNQALIQITPRQSRGGVMPY